MDFYQSEKWEKIRKKVLERDGHCCIKCGGKSFLHVHHLIPRSEGGKDEPSNLVTFCEKCHSGIHIERQVFLGERFLRYARNLILTFQRIFFKKGYNIEYALKNCFGWSSFRHAQKEIINTILSKKDTLVIMPTGSGKSLCYQLPAILFPNTTIIISPLIALMRDQVQKLHQKGIPATFINSTLDRKEKERRLKLVEEDLFKLVYIAPERFLVEKFQQILPQLKVSLFVVDEAHCIEMWGDSFRPAYLKLKEMIKILKPFCVAAFTATANSFTQKAIIEKLGLRDPQVFITGFNRPNISLNVFQCKSEETKRRFLIKILTKLKKPAIVYVSTIERARNLRNFLKEKGIKTGIYHGQMPTKERSDSQDGFFGGKEKILIATKAFGMGVDKKDIRIIIHYNIPQNLEEYFQEVGRAGRDGKPAMAIMLYHSDDKELQEWLIKESEYPAVEKIWANWKWLENKFKEGNLKLINFAKPSLPFRIAADTSFKILKAEKYIDFDSLSGSYRVTLLKPLSSLYSSSNISKKLNQLEKKQAKALKDLEEFCHDFILKRGCRRKYILNYFEETERKFKEKGRQLKQFEIVKSVIIFIAGIIFFSLFHFPLLFSFLFTLGLIGLYHKFYEKRYKNLTKEQEKFTFCDVPCCDICELKEKKKLKLAFHPQLLAGPN